MRESSNHPPKQGHVQPAILNCAVAVWKVGSAFLGIFNPRRQIEMLLEAPQGNLRMRWKYLAATREQAEIEWQHTEPERRVLCVAPHQG